MPIAAQGTVSECRILSRAGKTSPCPGTSIFASPSPHDEGVGRGPGRGADEPAFQNAPPLPGPLLHCAEEREQRQPALVQGCQARQQVGLVSPGGRRGEGERYLSAAWSQLGCVLPALFIAAFVCGCSTPRPAPPALLPEPVRTEIYGRANAAFVSAFFIKPAETGQTNSPAFKFAPLILQEVVECVPNLSTQTIATVYHRQDKVLIRGRSHDQFTYCWRRAAGATAPAEPARPLQGIRITLDAAGEPAVWEVLADTTGAEIIYVSETIEAEAAARFGKALPGRRFSVERGWRDAPRTIVAQAIPEGPLPMGPMVYVRAGTGDIASLACRCMPTRAERLAGQGYYQLAAWEAWRGSPGENLEPAALAPAASQWEQRLRLPRRF
jgi:hypothetical protein